MKLPRVLRLLGVYSVLGFAPLAVNFFLLPLYTSRLDPSEFGILAAANISYTFTALFIALGADGAYARFFFDHAQEPKRLDRLLATVLATIAATTLAGVLVFASFGERLFTAFWREVPFARYGWLVLWGGVVQVLYTILYSHYRNREDLRRVAALSLVGSLASVGGAIAAVLLWRADAYAAFCGRIAGLSLVTVYFLGRLLREMTAYRPDLALVRALAAYGVPVLAYTLVAYVLFNGDRIFMERFFSLHDLGLYSLATIIVSPMEIILQAGQQALQPSFYRRLDAGDPDAKALVSEFYNANLFIGVICMVGLVVLVGPLLTVFRGTKFLGSGYYLPILCFAQLFRALWTGYAFFVFYSKRTTVLPIVTALSILPGLGSAWLTRHALGSLCVPIGVLSWKVAQLLMTALAVRYISPNNRPNNRPVYGILALSGGYVVLVKVVSPAYANLTAAIAGLVLALFSAVQLRSMLRTGAFVNDVRRELLQRSQPSGS